MTLLELLELLRKKWYLVLVFPLVFAGATAAYCWGFMTNNYTANVSLYVLTQTTNATDGTGRVTSSDTSASQQLANDLAKIAKTSTVISSTANALGMSDLKGFDVGVTSDTTSRVITLTVTGKSPEGAASVANELADRTSKAAIDAMKLDAVNIIDRASVPENPWPQPRHVHRGCPARRAVRRHRDHRLAGHAGHHREVGRRRRRAAGDSCPRPHAQAEEGEVTWPRKTASAPASSKIRF